VHQPHTGHALPHQGQGDFLGERTRREHLLSPYTCSTESLEAQNPPCQGGGLHYQQGFIFKASNATICEVCCSVLQCAAVCCRVLQCVAVCCSEGVCAICRASSSRCPTLLFSRCVAGHCRVLQCVAVCCRVLPCVAVCCSEGALLRK